MPRKIKLLVYVGALLALLASSLAGAQAQSSPRQPVIIIPGVAGSEFSASAAFRLSVNNGHGGTYTRDYTAGEKVWVNVWQAAALGDDDYFDALKLQPNGDTPVAPALYVSGIYESAYSDLIDYLQDQGYVLNRDLWLFPFDWRRDIRGTTAQLDALVTRALAASGASRADIVAHSMGGMVARTYVSDPARAGRIDQLITLGSPQLGSVEFLKTLIYGDTFGPSFLGIGLNPDEIKDIVQNMAGAVQLLPSEPYYTYYDNSDSTRLRPYVESRDFDGNGSAGGVLSYAAVRQLLLNTGRNSTVLATAEGYHRAIDGQRNGGVNGVRWAALVGYGETTLGQIREYTGSCWSWFSYQPCPQREELPVEGDGTVALMSAAMGDPYRSTLINSGAQLWYVEREHGALVQRDSTLGITTGDGPVLPWIWGLLNGTIAMGGAAQPAPETAAQAELLRAASPVTRAPQRRLQGLWLSAIGPVALRVEDASGRAVGRTAGAQEVEDERLPGVRYERLPGAEFAFVGREGGRAFQIGAEQEGSVDVKLRVLADGQVAQTITFLGVYLGANGQARLAAPAGGGALQAGSLPALQVDADGDGAYEQTVAASALLDASASADTSAPTLRLRAPAQAKSGVVLSWAAEDGQAGLLREQGVVTDSAGAQRSVASGQPVKLAPGQYTLSVLAQDRAGNTSASSLPFQVR